MKAVKSNNLIEKAKNKKKQTHNDKHISANMIKGHCD